MSEPNLHLGRTCERWGADLAAAALVVVAVHGRDQSPAFMREVADRVALPWVAWVAPSADAGSWYPLSFLAGSGNEPRLTHGLAALDETLGSLAREGVETDRIAMVGFSQGAVLLSEYLVRGGTPCAAVVLLTGGYAGPPGVPRRGAGDLSDMPVLLGSATTDSLVPIERVRETAAVLDAVGAAVEFEAYDDLEHLVSDRAVASTRRVLTSAAAT